jgi:predicted SnoaL-like aldol condensation-catalyzing enzyme
MIKNIFIFIITLLLSSHALSAENDNMDKNKRTAIAFLEAVVNEKNFDKASAYLRSNYQQHNPEKPVGANSLKKFVEFLKSTYPNAHTTIKQVYADGDSVILFVHSVREPGTKGRAIVNIFKLKQNKIQQRWEVAQDII